MLKKSIALYLAGDENIIYPALVFFASVRKYNADIDLFLFLPVVTLPKEYLDFANSINASIIDNSELEKIAPTYIQKFDNMGRWPRSIFYNWLVPSFLELKGYQFAIKADYDMLCNGKFNIEEILPNKNEIVTLKVKGLIESKLDPISLSRIQKDLSLSLPLRARSANVGFVVIDLSEWCKLSLQKLFAEIYYILSNKISEWNGKIIGETVEQLAFAMLQGKIKHKFKSLSARYNYRPIVDPVQENPTIIHYNTILKPWLKIDLRTASIFQSKGFTAINQILLSSLWRDFANSLPIKANQTPPSYSLFELLNMVNAILLDSEKINSRKEILLSVREFLTNKLPLYATYKMDQAYSWIRIPFSKKGRIYFTIILNDDNVKCVLCFENELNQYSKYIDAFSLTPIPGSNIILNMQTGEIGYSMQTTSPGDIGSLMLSLYFQLKLKLDFFSNEIMN